MLWLRWIFIFINLAYCVIALTWERQSQFNRLGKVAGSSIWIWQLIGVGIVVKYGFSAWHLIWWFIVGLLLVMRVVRVLSLRGHDTVS